MNATELTMAIGPGKYEGELLITELVHSAGWTDEEVGDVSDFGWYGIIRGPIDLADDDPNGAMSAADAEYAKSAAGVILYENDQGFVSGTWYDSREAMESKWAEIQAEADDYYAGMDEEESDDEPTEPDDDDYIIGSSGPLGSRTTVSQSGKCLGEFAEYSEAEAFIREHRERENFYPNVWQISDHGNYHLTTL